MLNSQIFLILIGAVLGLLAGIGIGGGSLLILWLTLVTGMDPSAAGIVNLLFFVPSALISSCFRWHQGSIPWKDILPAIIAGCICAGVFSWFRDCFPSDLLRQVFGIILVITGIRETLWKKE